MAEIILPRVNTRSASSNCTDRRCVMCWRCPSSFPRMHSGAASERVTAAASPRCVSTERRKRARKSGRDHPSSRQHAECKFELHGPALRHVLEVPLFVFEDALRLSMPARDGRSIAKVRADRTSKRSAQKWQRSSFLASTRGVQVRTARTGAASCVGGAPLRFRGCTPAQQVSA